MNDFNKAWKFQLNDNTYFHKIDLDESEFRTIDLPHDFGIEQPYNEKEGDGCTGYLVGGIGVYRKHINIEEVNKKVFLYFDGIYNRSEIYVNEQFITFHPYGYSPLLLDVSEYLVEGDNVIAVRVDHTRYADSRWYTGSGIYRKAELFIYEKTYIPLFGVKVTANLENKQLARIEIHTEIHSECTNGKVVILSKILDKQGKIISETSNEIESKSESIITQELTVDNPLLWDIYQGNCYSVVSELVVDEQCVQIKETKFGIRKFSFDSDKGFELNGVNQKIKGVCLHHDAGLVGTSVPLDVWRRRLLILKECGVNAIRTAHNPASNDFLNLCDEMGFLVQEEFYDEWDNPKDKRYNGNEQKVDYITRGHHEFFKEYAKQDLQIIVKRDYNHPSIIQWSIGNEIEWTYPKYNIATGYFGANASGNYFWDLPPLSVEEIRKNIKDLPRGQYEVGTTAQKLADYTREIDTTRPITCNCILPSASYESGYTDAVDIVGFSYRQVVYERCHKNYPDKPIMGTENLAQWHEWKHVLEKEYIPGIFLWTGIDYIGESGNVDVWPRKATKSGLLDVAGFKKPSFYMFKSLWRDEPTAEIYTQTLEKSLYNLEDGELLEKEGCEWQKRLWVWQDVNPHYNYENGEMIVVECYSNCEELSLYQDDNVVGHQRLTEQPDHIYKWCIPYKAGLLTVRNNKGEVMCELQTANHASCAVIKSDKDILSLDYDDVAHIELELVDDLGRAVKYEESNVQFVTSENARIFGVDNGSVSFVGDHFLDTIETNEGKALMIIGANGSGTINIHAIINGNKSNEINIEIQK